MDNWSLCDLFKAKCILENKENFMLILEDIFSNGSEFYQRYALVTLLYYYAEEGYFPLIKSYLQRANHEKYYVHMAMAWLLAEILIKRYDVGVQWLQERIVENKTLNKAIQKARESFRLNNEQKEYLNTLKISKKG